MKNSIYTEEQQNALLRFFARISIEKKLEVMEDSRKKFYKLKEKNKESTLRELSYISLLKSIKSLQNNSSDIELKLIKMRCRNVKIAKKREKVIAKWSLIKTLKKEQGLSFRQISQYLEKFHKLKVAHSLIFELWQKIENNKKEEK